LVLSGGIFATGISGFTFDAAVKQNKDDSSVLVTMQTSATSTDSNGTLRLIIDPSSTDTITVPRGFWDLFATRTSDGYVEKLLEGGMTLAKKVTP
jgi:hypothetical protein